MIITGGLYKGRKIVSPDENITRPTLSKVRQGVFNTLFSMLENFEDKTFLDLFGGSGIMGLEAISRGFKEVIVCEKNPKVVQIIKRNYSQLKLTPNLRIGDSLKIISKLNQNFDVIYIDPPYYSGIYENIFNELKKLDLGDTIIITEHAEPLEIEDFNIIKEKNYGGKRVSFFSIKS